MLGLIASAIFGQVGDVLRGTPAICQITAILSLSCDEIISGKMLDKIEGVAYRTSTVVQ